MTHASNRSLANPGCHTTLSFSLSIFSFRFSTATNHWELSLKMRGDLHLQHRGYLCCTFPACSSLLSFSSSAAMSLSASLTKIPANLPAFWLNLQESSSGETETRP